MEHDFNKAVIAKKLRKSGFPEWNDHLAIKIFEGGLLPVS